MSAEQTTSWHNVRAAFQKIWGYDEFRPPQGEIVRNLLEQKDAMIIMPTGGGKSICFQLPALLQNGLTLVISPLVALMENQVQELRQRKLPAALLHSELPSPEKKRNLQLLEQQKLRLLYVSPETLLSPPVWERLCKPELKINGLILDEAHCLVQWGDTFRPAYRRLGTVRSALLNYKSPNSKIPVAAFTATADPTAQKTIQQVLQLENPEIFRLNPYRENLNLKVEIAWTPRGRQQKLLKFIQARPQQAGLIYVRTRRDSENLVEWLQQKGYNTAAYHAGLSAAERRAIEHNWISGQTLFVVCTSAFGMGIDKGNVRWVIHFHPTLLLSEYVQEIGRAGRDGKPSDTLLLMSEPTGWLDPEDKQRQKFFEDKLRSQQQKAQQLINKLPNQGEVNAIARQFPEGATALSLLHSTGQLKWQDPFHYILQKRSATQTPTQLDAVAQMRRYLSTRQCRWQFLLRAFGFASEAENLRCHHCDNCS